MKTPVVVDRIDEAIDNAAEQEVEDRAAAAGGKTLWASVADMGDMYMMLKNKGVDKENILDLIRIPFMFAGTSDPQFVAQAVADTAQGKEPQN